jgi:general L-amino acid transport system substrate-binding protein
MPNKEDFVILPDTISKEPLGPVVRQNDSRWRDVVVWTLYAMIQAEELGIGQANVDEFLTSDDVTVQRLLGTHAEEDIGAKLGLTKDWAYNVIKLVGNYGDVYERHLTPIGIPREGTLNALWTEGGLMYSPAYR